MTTQISVPAEGTQRLRMAGKAATAVLTGTKAAGRLLFVDNLRVFLTILVVVHHLAITYGASGSWSYLERPTTGLTENLLSAFTTFDHFYFMGLFFLISGYFVPGSLDRKGPWQFFKDRLVRLGIPFLVFGYLLSPVTSYFRSMQQGGWDGNLREYYLWSLRNLEFSSGPLWFVETLLVFSSIYALGRAVLSRVKSRHAEAGEKAEPAPLRPLTHGLIIGFILVLAPFIFVTRLFFPLDTAWQNLQLCMFPQYILLFAAGILAYRQRWLPELLGRVRKVWSTVAVASMVALPVLLILAGAIEDDAALKGGFTYQSMVASLWEAVYCTSMSILMLSLFHNRLDFQGSLGRLLSKNAYPIYIIHAPVIVSLAWLLKDVSIYPLLKFVLIAPVAVGLCFLISQFLVRRIPLAEKVL